MTTLFLSSLTCPKERPGILPSRTSNGDAEYGIDVSYMALSLGIYRSVHARISAHLPFLPYIQLRLLKATSFLDLFSSCFVLHETLQRREIPLRKLKLAEDNGLHNETRCLQDFFVVPQRRRTSA